MQHDDQTTALLTEIRDSQKELLTEYRRVANESLQLQQKSIENQERAIAQQSLAVSNQLSHNRLYRFTLVAIAIVVVYALWRLYSLPI